MSNDHNHERYFHLIRHLALLASESKDLNLLMLLVENHKLLTGESPLSQNTLRAYRRATHDFLKHVVDHSFLHKATQKDIQNYVDSMERHRSVEIGGGNRGRPPTQNPFSRNTVIQRLTAVRAVFSAFVWAGLCRFNPADGTHRSRAKTPATHQLVYYQDEELSKLFQAADIHDQCFLLLAAHGGLQAGEINSLKWQNVFLEEQVMHIEGPRPGIVHLSNKLTLKLLEFQAIQKDSGFISEFVVGLRTQTGLYRRLKNLCVISNVSFKGIQALRNTCGKNLLALTGDARVVQQHLRLRSLEQVQYYVVGTRPIAETIASIDF